MSHLIILLKVNISACEIDEVNPPCFVHCILYYEVTWGIRAFIFRELFEIGLNKPKVTSYYEKSRKNQNKMVYK
jgi:hypothetical protein